MLTKGQGYYVAYTFYLKYWIEIDQFRSYDAEVFDLNTVFGTGMHPFHMDKPDPVDPAKFEYWEEVIEELFIGKELFTKEEVFQLAIAYVEFHQREFAFELTEVLADFKSGKADALWEEVVAEVVCMIEKGEDGRIG